MKCFDRDGNECTAERAQMIVIGTGVFTRAFTLNAEPAKQGRERATSGTLTGIVQSLPFEGELIVHDFRDGLQRNIHEVARRKGVKVGTRSMMQNGKRVLAVWRAA